VLSRARTSRLAERTGLSPAEFLAWEASQPERHEYYGGEVFAMAGGSPRHNALAMNVGALLLAGLRDRGCTVLSSDQKLGLGQGSRYV
jgi:Uma2 family endonuclease